MSDRAHWSSYSSLFFQNRYCKEEIVFKLSLKGLPSIKEKEKK